MALRAVLAENLRRLRKERGLSQEAFADLADIDRTYVSALERQLYAATLDVLEQLAVALDVEPVELIQHSSVVTYDRGTSTITIQRSTSRRQSSK